MKLVLRYLLIAGFLFLIGFSYSYHLPRLKTWLLVKIEELSNKHLPVRIFPGDLTLSAWPPGVVVKNIRLLPKNSLAKKLAPMKVESISINLRPQSFITGDIRLSEIVINKPEVTLILKSEDSDNKSNITNLPIKEILNVPIQALTIENGTLNIKSIDAELLSRVETLSLSIENNHDSLYLNIDTPKINLKKSQNKSDSTQISIAGAALISDKEISIRGIKVKENDSFVIASGIVGGKISQLQLDNIKIKTRSHIVIPSVIENLSTFINLQNIPKIKGSLDLESTFESDLNTPPLIISKINAKNISVDQFKIGSISGDLTFKNEILLSENLEINNLSGTINLNKSEFSIKDENKFSSTVSLKNIELRQFLIQLSVGETPLHLLINSDVPCEGKIKPEFVVKCQGHLLGSDLKVHGTDPNRTIIAVDQLKAEGSVEVNKSLASTKAKLFVGDSFGDVTANIDYSKGFDIKYSTEQLDFKNIKNLGDLKIEGRAAIVGTTTGDSNAGKFQFKMKGQDIWFEDYGIGNATADVSYAAGSLYFKNIDGRFNTSRYFANVNVDLTKSQIAADGKLGFAEARDIQTMFSRKVLLPFDFFGNATAKLSVHGPLEFNKLTYELDSAVFRGSVGPEIFDEARFHVTAKNGFVKTQNVYLKKGTGTATMTGEGQPDGQINTDIRGRGFRIEDLSFFDKESNIQGTYNIDMSLKGHVLSPDAKIVATAKDLFIGKESVPDSKLDLKLNKNSFEGTANFLNDKVRLDFNIPFDLENPFKFKAKTISWNFTPVFGLLSKDVATREFEAELTSEIDLSASKGGFWNSTGTVVFDTFKIKRGNLELYNPNQGKISFENGKMTIRHFLLQGDNTFLKAEAANSTKNDFNVSLNGKVEMSLLAFLTPFFSDMRGVLSISGQLDGNSDNPKMIGSAFIDRGYAKLKEFPHAFEEIKADILFSQQKILVNSLQALFAGGTAYTEGEVEIRGFKNFPTKLKGRFDKVTLLVPKDFSTNGSGEFNITGNWFPFLLAGQYNITKGIISREFGENNIGSETIKRSTFLPTFLLQKDFAPLRFDLTANFPANLLVKNTMVEAEIRGNTRITGTPNDPILFGDVTLVPGGRFMFRDTPFEITDASIKFNNPNKINPSLYAQASTRIKDYDVNLLLQGTQESYRIQLRSTPPLAEQEIISLLALGYTSEQLEKVQSDQQIDQQSYEIGSALLSNNPLGNEIRNKYGVTVRFGSAVDDTNQVAPKIIISKQWTPRINTSASRTMGNVVTQDAKLEYLLNKNISVIGSWEAKQYSEEQKSSETESKGTDIFGLDLQYKVEFK